jgi:hypothetical protein
MFHLVAQNAGLFIHRWSEGTIVIEAFEVASTTEAVMSTTGRLIRNFPGRAVTCPSAEFFKDEFRSSFVKALCQLRTESIELYTPKSRKAGNEVKETRETSDPGMVIDWLMTILGVIGSIKDTFSVEKRVREDILWNQTELCWQRSPFWLVIRVTVLRTLMTRLTYLEALKEFKRYMVHLVAHLMDLACSAESQPDLVSILHAKLARRARKFEKQWGDISSPNVMEISARAKEYLEEIWRRYTDKPETVNPVPTEGWEQATYLSLPNARQALIEACEPLADSGPAQVFIPPEQTRIPLTQQSLPRLERSAIKGDPVFYLADFELWVETNLRKWTATKITRPDSKVFDDLNVLIEDYWKCAIEHYEGKPLELSLALLTTLELWRSLDELCIAEIPLLATYPPEIVATVLESLLLPKLQQMKRLANMEAYINSRHHCAFSGNPSIFADPVNRCFAVEHFQSSHELQSLQTAIENADRESRGRKVKELESLAAKYDRLLATAKSLAHTMTRSYNGDYSDQVYNCDKCQTEREAANMRITVNEDSLPRNTTQSKAAVFELGLPVSFAAWRDSTWLINNHIGRQAIGPRSGKHYAMARSYVQLESYCQPSSRTPTITLQSSTKSFLQARYSQTSFPTTADKVCVNNGLQYKLANTTAKQWLSDVVGAASFKTYCTFNLPPGKYNNLEWAMVTSLHTANKTMARQCECSDSLEIREFIAFCNLRAGERLQWLNILRELGCLELNQNDAAVATLFMQAIWEVGTASSDVRRRAHGELSEILFDRKLLIALNVRLQNIRSNWKEHHSLTVVIQLTLRLLSLGLGSEVVTGCLDLLKSIRQVTLNWCERLKSHISENYMDERAQENSSMLLLRSALLCLETFDVDSGHLAATLNSQDDLAIVMTAQIIISEHMPVSFEKLPAMLHQALVHRCKIAHKIMPVLQAIISQDGSGLRTVILGVWDGVSLPSDWSRGTASSSSWVSARTIPLEGAESQTVHVSVYSGDLLVDGKPIGKVPRSIVSQPLYQQVFGPAILRVFASPEPGMDYQVSKRVGGAEIHIGSRGGQVLIRARTQDSFYTVLPQSFLSNDLPSQFSTMHTHFLNESRREVEFRSLKSPWKESSEDWVLSFSGANLLSAGAQMATENKRLIDHGSMIGKSILHIVRPIETSSACHILLDNNQAPDLQIFLPRFNLHFTVTACGQLKSLEFNAVVDSDQHIGTLIGLQNKLVLKDMLSIGRLSERQVILPYGDVQIQKAGMHVTVSISGEKEIKQRYFVYRIDRHLNKLQGQPGVLSSLHKSYLHAVTSFCLCDPFTKRSGTEEAIALLQEASLYSSIPLTEEEVAILMKISALTPGRRYYPAHKRCMQTVDWSNNLSSLSQHDDFLPAASAILTHHGKFSVFYSSPGEVRLPDRGADELLIRARSRNASVMRSSLYDGDLTHPCDRTYSSRDRSGNVSRAAGVQELAVLLKTWPANVSTHQSLVTVLKGWDTVSGYHLKFDSGPLSKLLNVQYKEQWGSLYDLCRLSTRSSMTHQLMFTLGAMAIGAKGDDLLHLKTLLAFATSGVFRMDDPPASHQVYDLGQGEIASLARIEAAVSLNSKDIDRPSYPSDAELREYRAKLDERQRQVERLSHYIHDQWPEEGVSSPSRPKEYYFLNYASATTACQVLFDVWHKNRRFLTHIRSLDAKLATRQAGSHKSRTPSAGRLSLLRNRSIANVITLDHLVSTDLFAVTDGHYAEEPSLCISPSTVHGVGSQVETLVSDLRIEDDLTRLRYTLTLRASCQALQGQSLDAVDEPIPLNAYAIESHHTKTLSHFVQKMRAISLALAPRTTAEILIEAASLWPRITPQALLSLLSAKTIMHLSASWRKTILDLGGSIASLQRAERMFSSFQALNRRAFWNDLKNPGRQGWSAADYPTWLLLEIENDITIRPLQAKVAIEMMAPESRENTALQLNMGEGKSSVIVPMLVSCLADGKRLARVIVLKPLLRQTEHVLSQRLGGLLRQRVCHIPFSRKANYERPAIERMHDILVDCKAQYGFMITLPEEMLSMGLMTKERLPSGTKLASHVLGLERWLLENSRCVIDECDEILGIRSQLIYPVGSQQMLDGGTDRWAIPQGMLRRVKFHAACLAASRSGELEIEFQGKEFPLMKVFCPDVYDCLVKSLVRDVMDGMVGGISFDFFTDGMRSAIERFISMREVSVSDIEIATEACSGTRYWTAILILRGLLAHNVLCFALQRKRWLVEYGLDLSRCLMAVPYRAKGVPSTNSEFAHPDVGIILTCLGYYYTGLSLKQIETCFVLLSKDPNSEDTYSGWICDAADVPSGMLAFEAINLEDRTFTETILFPTMRYNLEIIDFFLNKVVFPKEGKEFSKRISASGWDIPSPAGRPSLLTTGFSGTNDSRDILPYSILQRDLPELHHTNAMVLDFILKEENRKYMCGADASGKNLSNQGLFSLLSGQTPRVNVLIDVGAQVLESTNSQLIKGWLDYQTDARAGLYFDDEDEAMVMDRTGNITPLRISPFKGKLEGCLIYLDEVHTRGIDLAIPIGAHAAVTLGPRLVKDRLVQGKRKPLLA